jgi:hypothetical protein
MVGERQAMAKLTDEERIAFLDIFAGEHSDAPIPIPILESLVTQGLLTRGSDGTIIPTAYGEELYQKWTGDEPYEGV